MYFLSGIGAAAAVNLLTAIPVSDLNGVQSMILAGFSVPWFFASLMLAWTAAAIEDGQRRCSLLPSDRLNERETEELRKKIFDSFRRKIIFRAFAATIFVVAGSVVVSQVKLQDYRTINVEPNPAASEGASAQSGDSPREVTSGSSLSSTSDMNQPVQDGD